MGERQIKSVLKKGLVALKGFTKKELLKKAPKASKAGIQKGLTSMVKYGYLKAQEISYRREKLFRPTKKLLRGLNLKA